MVHITEKNTKILVCCHKPCELPKDPLLLPIQVGKAISQYDLGITGDDTGDNISSKNKNFCELTAMYWAWKNIKKEYPDLEYIGLFHYRRFFDFSNKITNLEVISKKENDAVNYLISAKYISKILSSKNIIVSKKRVFPYSLKIDYCLCHISDDFTILRNIIYNNYPEYKRSFYYVFEVNNKLSPCNMFIMKYSDFCNYCNWLFSILFQAEKEINISNYSERESRIFGYMAERLFNLYIYHNKFKIGYLPVLWYNDKYTSLSHFLSFYQNIKNNISAHFLYLSETNSVRTYISNFLYSVNLSSFTKSYKKRK